MERLITVKNGPYKVTATTRKDNTRHDQKETAQAIHVVIVDGIVYDMDAMTPDLCNDFLDICDNHGAHPMDIVDDYLAAEKAAENDDNLTEHPPCGDWERQAYIDNGIHHVKDFI